MSNLSTTKTFDLHNVEEEDHWISVSDLMAGLMMVFLFVSIALMRNAMLEKDKIQEIAVAYQDTQVAIYNELMREFKHDLVRWEATIDRDTLSFEFTSPEVLFDQGDITLKRKFREILSDFFPRYLNILLKYEASIKEVRIEGHTSTDWKDASTDRAYFNNMKLSQGRTRSVLEYVYLLDPVETYREWVKKNIAAVGFSSAHTKKREDGKEDAMASRRVSFRVVTNAETQIRKIIGD